MHHRSRTFVLGAVLAITPVLGGACGGSSLEKVDADDWVADVCDAALDFQDDFLDAAGGLDVVEDGDLIEMDVKGRKLNIWKLPQPGPLYCTEEESAGVESGSGVPREAEGRLAGSYVNFLITNDRIVYPLLDAATDGEAQRILEEIFPEHKVVGVPAREILLGGGNIHCITQQIPSGK